MIKYTLCFLYVFSFNLMASEEILLNSIYESLIQEVKKTTPPKESKSSLNNGKRGKLIIEQMKKKNRERLARLRGLDPSKINSGKDIVEQSKKENKKLISTINEELKKWNELSNKEILNIRKKMVSNWRQKHKDKLKQWEALQKKFSKNKDSYKNSTFDFPLVLDEVTLKKVTPKKVIIKKESHIVKEAMNIPVRNQLYRPTCSAFAGVRALEIGLAQNKTPLDLSEQYFYWLSKKECQKRKCSKKGSWVGYGLEQSLKSIPLEKDCPYNPVSISGNETQIPLARGCSSGVVSVSKVEYFQDVNEVIRQLKSNRAVIAGIKLSPNFYENKALILNRDKNSSKKMDSHSAGHAVTFVGFVKLPKVLNEGRVCFITANSWGSGWGVGGHSCISEKWLLEQKQVNPFVSVSKLEVNKSS